MRKNSLTDEQIGGWWDIARAGLWKGTIAGAPTRIEITAEDLHNMAADYDPQVQEAPVTVEHHREGPAHGWVAAVRVFGDRLQARFADLSESLSQWLCSGAYRSRSIEMYKPFETTGRAYLGAVSFLGAAPPAVKGLAPEPSVMAEKARQGVILVGSGEMKLSKELSTTGEVEMDDRTIAERAVHALKEIFIKPGSDSDRQKVSETDSESAAAKLSGLEAELEQQRQARLAAEERLAQLENTLRSREQEAELASFASALEGAAKEGRLTPAELKGYYRLGSRLDQTGRTAILEEVARRQQLALFQELSAPGNGQQGAIDEIARRKAEFSSFPEDPDHDAALELISAEPGLTFEEAIKRVRLESSARG